MNEKEEEKKGYWEWLLPFEPPSDVLPESFWRFWAPFSFYLFIFVLGATKVVLSNSIQTSLVGIAIAIMGFFTSTWCYHHEKVR